jgi:hypothetical protein
MVKFDPSLGEVLVNKDVKNDSIYSTTLNF